MDAPIHAFNSIHYDGIKYETLAVPVDSFVLSGSGSQPGTDGEVEMSLPAGSGQIHVLSGITTSPLPLL